MQCTYIHVHRYTHIYIYTCVLQAKGQPGHSILPSISPHQYWLLVYQYSYRVYKYRYRYTHIHIHTHTLTHKYTNIQSQEQANPPSVIPDQNWQLTCNTHLEREKSTQMQCTLKEVHFASTSLPPLMSFIIS